MIAHEKKGISLAGWPSAASDSIKTNASIGYATPPEHPCYPATTGVLGNNTLLVLDEGQQTMPDYFAMHGYQVTQFGKVFHAQNRGLKRGATKPEKPAGWLLSKSVQNNRPKIRATGRKHAGPIAT